MKQLMTEENTIYKQLIDFGYTSKHNLLQYVSKGIFVSDAEGKIIEVNDCALQLLNCNRYDLIFQNYEVLLNYIEYRDEPIQRYIDKVSKDGHAMDYMIRKDSFSQKIYLKFESIKEKNGKFTLTTISDETEKLMLEKQLKHNDSLTVIGQMAASIAHEIRNPMTSLKGFTKLLKEQATDEAMGYLSIIESELHRMDRILGEMLFLSKPRTKQMGYVDVENLLQDVFNLMLPHALMHKCMFRLLNDVQVPLVIYGCQNSLKQVFINLLKNGLESMPNGGLCTIELKQKDGKVVVLLTDEGVGMSEEMLQNIYIPFRTTKQDGTGLGLPTVKKIVKDHSGTIDVQSELCTGTTFTLTFTQCIVD